ncbi:MAG: Gfo/Idh/MocA family oxidoreductase [Victivallaceae bacterium]|nr:Gfo/Idh/MocA family oxidoreductase [Victivallaceae bacterium]
MGLKIAFSGLRHAHIFSLLKKAVAAGLEIVAVCEEDPDWDLLSGHPEVKITHRDFAEMLASTDCDIVAIGDFYAKRGETALRALRAGKHIISDKPLCTTLHQLNEIEAVARDRKLKIGCMYELRYLKSALAVKRLISSGTLGEITQIQFNGQHPLDRAHRPGWYFEPGKHGGTINDLAGHAVDLIMWLTASPIRDIVFARTWQTPLAAETALADAAQMGFSLKNGCGVIGDVSYSALDSFGFGLPTYWRFNIWGTRGMVEFSCADEVRLYRAQAKQCEILVPDAVNQGDYLSRFLDDVEGKTVDPETVSLLFSARKTLEIQDFADQCSGGIPKSR